jgi:hypothetical protein
MTATLLAPQSIVAAHYELSRVSERYIPTLLSIWMGHGLYSEQIIRLLVIHGRYASNEDSAVCRSPYADAIRSKSSGNGHFVSRHVWCMTHPYVGASNMANTSNRCPAIRQAAHAISDDRKSGQAASTINGKLSNTHT